MKKEGTNTASTQSMARNRGTAVKRLPSRRPGDGSVLSIGVDVLNLDRCLVHENTNRQCQTSKCHQIDCMAADPESDHRGHDRQWNVEDDDQRAAPVAENSSTIRPVRTAPKEPSMNKLRIARVTYGDWSNSKLTRMSSGNSFCIFGKALLISR